MSCLTSIYPLSTEICLKLSVSKIVKRSFMRWSTLQMANFLLLVPMTILLIFIQLLKDTKRLGNVKEALALLRILTGLKTVNTYKPTQELLKDSSIICQVSNNNIRSGHTMWQHFLQHFVQYSVAQCIHPCNCCMLNVAYNSCRFSSAAFLFATLDGWTRCNSVACMLHQMLPEKLYQVSGPLIICSCLSL